MEEDDEEDEIPFEVFGGRGPPVWIPGWGGGFRRRPANQRRYLQTSSVAQSYKSKAAPSRRETDRHRARLMGLTYGRKPKVYRKRR